MAEKFPDWAPQIAIKWYEDSIKCNDDTRNKLREILLSHPNMESVWKTLRRRKSIYGESGETTDYIVFFRRAVHLKLLADSNKPNWEKLTPIKRKKLKLKIESLIDELGECIDLVPNVMLENMVDFLPEDIVLDLAVRQDKKIKRVFCNGDQISSTLTIEMIKIFGFGKKMIKDHLKNLKIISRDIDPEFGLLKRPGKVNSNQLFFIRRLGIYLKRTYGTFLYEVIANTASALYENPDIDEDVVRHAIKGIDIKKVNKYENYM